MNQIEMLERMQKENARTKNKGFTMVNNTFIESEFYSGMEKVILFNLKSHCFQKNKSWPSISNLVKSSGYCRTSIIKALKSLEEKGAIKKTKGEHRSTTYTVKIGPFKILPVQEINFNSPSNRH